jgi:hypothetical protein
MILGRSLGPIRVLPTGRPFLQLGVLPDSLPTPIVDRQWRAWSRRENLLKVWLTGA